MKKDKLVSLIDQKGVRNVNIFNNTMELEDGTILNYAKYERQGIVESIKDGKSYEFSLN